jgi:hypothetical protein
MPAPAEPAVWALGNWRLNRYHCPRQTDIHNTGNDITLAPAELATWTPGNRRIKSYYYPRRVAVCYHRI